ncbi:zinc-dependent alcohol dehydrogenase family protein [Flavitalea flava]
MKSYHVTYGGGLESLILREHETPVPGPGQVLVRVYANSLNFREIAILRGRYPLPVKQPDVVAVSDGAGEVVAVGPGVSRTKPGDRVMATLFPHWTGGPFSWENAAQTGGSLDGLLTEFALLQEEAVVQIPDHLSYNEAATLPCAAVTAWNALMDGRPVLAGETVLTLGSGGVSLFALQFAKLAGARVIATTGSEEKEERLKALGADEVINYRRTPDWHLEVRKLTGGKGVEKVIEIGSDSFDKSIKSTAVEGQISFVGRLGAGIPTIDLNTLFGSVASIRVVATGSRAHFRAMNQAIAAHKLRPVIDKVFSFGQAHDAYRYYEAGNYFGKIIISQC